MGAHARGAAPTPPKAAGLAAPTDVTAMASEARWQRDHASPAVRKVLPRLPCPTGRAGMLGALTTDLHTQLAERLSPATSPTGGPLFDTGGGLACVLVSPAVLR